VRTAVFISIAASGLALASMVLTAPTIAREQGGRFTMTPADNGFVKLDTETGAVSFCSRKPIGSFQCVLTPDDRQKLVRELDGLKAENEEMRQELARLRPLTGKDGEGQRTFRLPSEEEVDKALTYMQRMMRKFRDKLKEFEKDLPPKREL
jgi:hypothetical protein